MTRRHGLSKCCDIVLETLSSTLGNSRARTTAQKKLILAMQIDVQNELSSIQAKDMASFFRAYAEASTEDRILNLVRPANAAHWTITIPSRSKFSIDHPIRKFPSSKYSPFSEEFSFYLIKRYWYHFQPNGRSSVRTAPYNHKVQDIIAPLPRLLDYAIEKKVRDGQGLDRDSRTKTTIV